MLSPLVVITYSWAARRCSPVNKNATNASTDAAINFAIQQATRAREDQLRAEDFARSKETLGLQQQFQDLERQKQEAFQSGQTDKAQAFQEQQNALQRQAEQKQGQMGLLGSGISGAGGLLGTLLTRQNNGFREVVDATGNKTLVPTRGTGIFGAGGVAQGFGNAFMHPFNSGPMGAAGTSSNLAGSAAGIGAGLLGGGYAGQSLAKLTGKNTREAKAGSLIGAGIGSALGPLGGVAGGALGGLVTKGIQGIFCFDALTPIYMEDGTEKTIQDIRIGDMTMGGEVYSVRQAKTSDIIYSYKGIQVSANHAVKEFGLWKRVKNTVHSVPLKEGGMVWSIATSNHLIYVYTKNRELIMFADEMETDLYEWLTLDQSLEILNKEAVYGF